MGDAKPTDGELAEVGLSRSAFSELSGEAREYVLDRLKSYERLDKLYQITEVVVALEKESGEDASKILSSEIKRRLVLDVVRGYRSKQRSESITEFYRKWTKKR